MQWGISADKLLLIMVAVVMIVGPQRLPGLARSLAGIVRAVREQLQGASDRIREEVGPEFEDIDWRKLDPRRYDPRAIISAAFLEPDTNSTTVLRGVSEPVTGAVPVGSLDTGAKLMPRLDERSTMTRYAAGKEKDEMTRIASDMYANQFTKRHVVVTGAAGGMGAAIARAFAEAGAAVCLLDRSSSVLTRASELLADGFDARAQVVDVTVDSDVVAAIDAVGQEWGVIDILVNNAGTISVELLEDLTTAETRRVLNVNTVAPITVTREALPWLRKSAHAVVLNSASAQARDGFIYTPHYAASKFGVMGLTQSLAKEFAKEGIRVNAYCPGIVKTDMWGYLDGAWGAKLGDYKPGELVDEWIADIPLGRAATESDVANLLLFLASDAAEYITGQTINIDGGMSMD